MGSKESRWLGKQSTVSSRMQASFYVSISDDHHESTLLNQSLTQASLLPEPHLGKLNLVRCQGHLVCCVRWVRVQVNKGQNWPLGGRLHCGLGIVVGGVHSVED